MLKITDIPVEGYELVRRGVDRAAGLHAIVAIHSTVMGPALGGMRMWPYATEQEALTDVLRLARGMTYKAVCAGLKLGGGKSVVIGEPSIKTEMLLRSMGDFVDSFQGRYITAEDVNTRPEDMTIVADQTRWVSGVPGRSGNPSPYTAHGCFVGLQATLEEVYGTDDMAGKVFAMEGCGSVGSVFGQKIAAAGGTLLCADIRPAAAEALARETGGTVLDPSEVFDADCVVLCPCALGGSLNDDTIPRLKVRAVVGGANNQLQEPRHDEVLRKRGILYSPDYVVNAGGLINVYQDVVGDVDHERTMRRMSSIYDNLKAIYTISRQEGIGTSAAADRFAEQRLAEAQAAAGA